MRWISRLTTVVIVITFVVAIALLIRSKIPSSDTGGAFLTYVKVRDASRLAVGSPVVIAGVRVGDITRLTIEGRLARVDMRLREGINLPIGTFATKRADSLFGDSYLELVPSGEEPVVLLKSGEPIRHVQEGGSTDATLRAIARTMPKIDEALENVHELMTSGRQWVNGTLVETLNDVDVWLAAGNLERPLASADDAMKAFEDGTAGAAKAVADAAPDIDRRLASFDKMLKNARTDMREAKLSLQTGLADARTRFDDIDEPVADMLEIMSAIDEGRGDDWKGTLGRLVNDPSLANDLEDFSGDVADGAAGLNRFRSWLGGRAEVAVKSGEIRVYATAELYTRTDKLFLIEFSYSNLGTFPSSNLADAAGNPQFTRTQQIRDDFRFTAQFGKRLGFAQGRIGIKDSTPGIGADALFFNGRLKLSADLFGSFEATPRLKLAGAFAVFRSIYILAGVDDVLNTPGTLPVRPDSQSVPTALDEVHYGRDFFLGASLHFTDADLATILRFYGALIAGYALAR